MEHVSPCINSENHGGGVRSAPMPQSNWHFPGSREMSEVGARKPDGYDNLLMDPQQGGNILWIIMWKNLCILFLLWHACEYSIVYLFSMEFSGPLNHCVCF